MAEHADIPLLKLAWSRRVFPEGGLVTADGRRVTVENPGEENVVGDYFTGARISIDGEVHNGDVDITLTGFGTPADNVVLRVTAGKAPVSCYSDGSLVPQAILNIPDEMLERYGKLRKGSEDCACAGILASHEPFNRTALVTRLVSDRLLRKHGELAEIFENAESNWNDTMYVMAFRAMAGPRNKDSFTELARRVPYWIVSNERASLFNVEAMLLGASGLLNGFDEDEQMCRMNDEFEHMRRKYDIKPMRPTAWQRAGGYPSGNPILRIAQLAAFFCQKEFVFNKLMKCSSGQELYELFRVEASEYWSEHYVPQKKSGRRAKGLGYDKAQLMGINMVVPLQFAYGKYAGDEELSARALSLLEELGCEDNAITRKWIAGGMTLENAFDSQGILELNNEYCKHLSCASCPVGRRVIMAP